MQNISAKSGQRESRTRATFQASQKTREEAAGDTPTVRQRIAEARRSGILDLRGMGLTQLPLDATKIHQLTALLIGDNKFKSIPANIVQSFPQLVFLDLSYNRITSIPPTLADLEDLELLDLEGNPDISQIPTSFGPLVDMGKLAVIVGSGDDVAEVELNGDEGEGDEEEETAKSERYASDEEYLSEDEDSRHTTPFQKRYREFLDAPANEDSKSDRSVRSAHSSTSNVDFEALDSEFRALLGRLVHLDNDAIENNFRKRWAANDAVLAKYVSKRYGSEVRGSEGRSRTSSARRNAPRREDVDGSQEDSDEREGSAEEETGAEPRPVPTARHKREKEAARRAKERNMKREVHGGRKVKETLQSRED
ncbi:hypothetical protein HDV00_004176 [Rhizophlyctis rosea]|nr:hypothetical protein HDV00_004176 [Rhizophlyctis rosea]